MKSKTSAALVLIATFVMGGITGAVAFSLYQTRAAPPAAKGGTRGAGTHNIVETLAAGLNLDPAQTEQLKEIITRSREKYRGLSQEFRPSYDQIRQETRREIRQILRNDQIPRFEEIILEMDRRQHGRSGKYSFR